MGMLGALFMFGGLALVVLGVVGIVIGAFEAQWLGVLYSFGLVVGGLIAGGLGVTILE